MDSENEIRTYFNYQSWVTENLFFDGLPSQVYQ